MVPTLSSALRHILQELSGMLAPLALHEICRAAGCPWGQRLLGPVTTVHLLLLQVLQGNTACALLRRLAGYSFTASAYCQAHTCPWSYSECSWPAWSKPCSTGDRLDTDHSL